MLEVTPLGLYIDSGFYKGMEREREREKMVRAVFLHFNCLRILLRYWGGGWDELGDWDIYTLLCIKWITNENLFCSKGNSPQWSAVNLNGKEKMHVSLIHSAVIQKKLIQNRRLYSTAILQ